MSDFKAIKLYYTQYDKLLHSGDENIVKDALQQIFESYTDHHLQFAGDEIAKFEKVLCSLVKSKSKKVRKWAYHCVVICDIWAYYKADNLIKKTIEALNRFELSKGSITYEQADNILWALIAISNHYNDDIAKRFFLKYHDLLKKEISEDYMSNASIIFGRSSNLKTIDVKGILDRNCTPELLTLSHIYGYKRYLTREKKAWVTESTIHDLTKHETPQIREIGYWALARNAETDKISSIIKQDPDEDFGARKWQLALQVNEGDIDFIKLRLSELSDPRYSDEQRYQLKNGILRGLFLEGFIPELVEPIRVWFFGEEHIQTRLSLLKYMMQYWSEEKSNFEFIQVLNWALDQKEYRDYVIQSIKSDPSETRNASIHARNAPTR